MIMLWIRDRIGFIECPDPKCDAVHVAKTIMCRGCNWKPDIPDDLREQARREVELNLADNGFDPKTGHRIKKEDEIKKNECPVCKSDLTGKEIPEESRELYGGETHFSRTIGIEIQGVYDGVVLWECPDCEARWHRFTGQIILPSERDKNYFRVTRERIFGR